MTDVQGEVYYNELIEIVPQMQEYSRVGIFSEKQCSDILGTA